MTNDCKFVKTRIKCPDCVEYEKRGYGVPAGKCIGRITEDDGFLVTRCGVEMKFELLDCELCHGTGYIDIDSPECPKCREQYAHGAPRGKIARNPYSATKFYDDCPACNGKGYISDAVIEGIFARYGDKTQGILYQLKGATDHYYFYIHNMYVGVEWSEGNEGYCHT